MISISAGVNIPALARGALFDAVGVGAFSPPPPHPVSSAAVKRTKPAILI
jgi:hypothetical protein